MKRKIINEVFETNGTIGFRYENGLETHTWLVALCDDRMVAKNTVSYSRLTRSYYRDVPYESMEACNNIYDEIVLDFVDCYADSWRELTAGPTGVFRNFADKDDLGLQELLSYFGVSYDEFLLDVFYWYARWTQTAHTDEDKDEDGSINDICNSCDKRSYSVTKKYEQRLTKKVLMHLPCTSVVFGYDSNVDESWHFALAHNELWYGHITSDGHNMIPFDFEEYGHVALFDINAFEALRAAVLKCTEAEGVDQISIYGNDDVLSVLDLSIDELKMKDE